MLAENGNILYENGNMPAENKNMPDENENMSAEKFETSQRLLVYCIIIRQVSQQILTLSFLLIKKRETFHLK